jgi:hypothetical protein
MKVNLNITVVYVSSKIWKESFSSSSLCAKNLIGGFSKEQKFQHVKYKYSFHDQLLIDKIETQKTYLQQMKSFVNHFWLDHSK